MFFFPIFGVSVKVPHAGPSDDLNTPWGLVKWGKEVLFGSVNSINTYLRWSIWLVATIVVIYGWFKLLTAQWDEKAMKQAQWAFIGAAVGVFIAMLSYAIVKIVINIM